MSSSSSFNFGSDVNYSRWSNSRPFLRNEDSFWKRTPSAAEAFARRRYVRQPFKRNKKHESTGVHLPSIFSSATYRSPRTVVHSKHLEFDRTYSNERECRLPLEGKGCKESLLRLVEKAVKQNLNAQKSHSNFGARVRDSLGLSQGVNNNKSSTTNIFGDSARHTLEYAKVQQGSDVIKPLTVKNKLSAITILLSGTHSAPTNTAFNKNFLRGRRDKRELTETNYIIGSDSNSPVMINRGVGLAKSRRQNGRALPSQNDLALPAIGQSSNTHKKEDEVDSQTKLNQNDAGAATKEPNTIEASTTTTTTTNAPAEVDSNGLDSADDIHRWTSGPLVSASAGSKGQKAKANSLSAKRVLSVPKPRGSFTRPRRTAVTAGSFRKKEEAKKNDAFENESTAAAASRNGSNVTSATTGDNEHPEGGQGVECAVNVVDQRLVRVLSGDLSELPHLPCHVVRIFTSSTFTDTTLERNCLMENVYPKLKDYCRERHGLDFQVVDMRWGVRDEATDDHMTTDLCMNEIDNCQRLSVGPNFCVLLGQKYGYRPIPTLIPAAEFELLQEAAAKDNHSEAALLQQWYRRDDNSVPSVHVLQPISSILTNFNNKRTQKLKENDQEAWWDILSRLQKILRRSAYELYIRKKMDQEQMYNYVMSVTEREVRRGIIDAKDTDKHCLAYVRNIRNMDLTAANSIRNFVDMTGQEVDSEAEHLLSVLRDDVLPSRLADTNVARFTVDWSGDQGLDVQTHAEYLRQFCEVFDRDIKGLVDRAMDEMVTYGENNQLYEEALRHLHSCQNLCTSFQGREEELDDIRNYIVGDSTAPLVLWGESGCGKTALIAKGFSMVNFWLPSGCRPLMILRFLGTSPDSSSVVQLLSSICRQICFYYRRTGDYDSPSDLNGLISRFKSLLSLATKSKPLILFLDSLDQLSSSDAARQLSWFPVCLPRHCKLVVSVVVQNYFGTLDRLRHILETPSGYLHILPVGPDLALSILRYWLAKTNRTVSAEQWKIVEEAIGHCSIPLYIRMVFGEISRWRSYHRGPLTTLASGIRNGIIKIFERIENQHGKTLVSHAFGYVTLSKSGLTETELEDLLSLDEKVLNDVYQYHLPPVRRIPPLLWTRIRSDLSYYFTERQVDGVNVIDWYHSHFDEVSRDRYFKNVNVLRETHSQMADYFVGVWGGGVPKPFEYTELQCQRFGLESSRGSSDRKVPEQPLFFADETGRINRYNLRKLNELPYHLVRAKRFEALYDDVLFSFRWLHAKLSSAPLQLILADFDDVLGFQYEPAVKILADTIRLSASVLSRHPDMLAAQIVGRLLPYYSSYDRIRDLLIQCDSEGARVNALIPCHPYLHTPGGPLEHSLEGHPFAPFGVGVTSDGLYLVSVSSVLVIWDLTTGDVFRQMSLGVKGIMRHLVITGDDRTAVTYTSNNQVIICTILTGDFKIFENVAVGTDEIVDAAVNGNGFLIWSRKDWFLYAFDGRLMDSYTLDETQGTIVYMDLGKNSDEEERYLIRRLDKTPAEEIDDDDDDGDEIKMILEISNGGSTDAFAFHSAIAISRNKKVLFACTTDGSNAISCHRRRRTRWNYDQKLDNSDVIYSLLVSDDGVFVVASVIFGFKRWNAVDNSLVLMKLPEGVRNIPSKTCMNNLFVLTKNNEFLVAAVRMVLFVWDARDGDLIKTLDVHFGRIISLMAVTCRVNKVISASIDKTIKVWNLDKILEDVHHIDRLEKPIDGISVVAAAADDDDDGKGVVTAESSVVVTPTRSCIGVWNMKTGRLTKRLSNGSHSIVTHAVVTRDGQYVISAESGNVVVWDVASGTVVRTIDKGVDVLQMMLIGDDSKLVILSRESEETNKLVCTCRSISTGKVNYRFEHNIRRFVDAKVTRDGASLIIVGLSSKGNESLLFHRLDSGSFQFSSRLKLHDNDGGGGGGGGGGGAFHRIVPLPTHVPNRVALIDGEKGAVWDCRKKSIVKILSRWSGIHTRDGRLGLCAPNRGGLELLDLKTGATVFTLIPRVAEGVFGVRTLFSANDRHVIYYHSGKRSIRVFRVSDGRQIADYKTHAEITDIASAHGGRSLVLGAVDGSVIVLSLADSEMSDYVEFLTTMHDREPISSRSRLTSFSD